MFYDVTNSLSILCNREDSVKGDICKHVMESLENIEGLTGYSNTCGTNLVIASAKWKESDVSQKVIQIKNIHGVADVRVNKHVKVNIMEHIQLSEEISGTLMKDPIGEIMRAEKDKDYFKAFSYACSVFGNYGKQILLRNCLLSKSKVDDMTLSRIIEELYRHGIVSNDIREKINYGKKMRDKFEHGEYSTKIDFKALKKCQEEIGKLLDCVKFLKQQYDKLDNKQ